MRGPFFISLVAVLAGTATARAEEIQPLALPPMFYIDDAATVAATITDTKRAISAQYDAAEKNLFEIGGGGVIDEMKMTYSLQLHVGLGERFTVFKHPLMNTGEVRVAIDMRAVAETIFTQPGKEDAYAFRMVIDGGVGAWAVTPKQVRFGLHVGFDYPLTDPIDRSPEFVTAAMIGIPFGEPDPHAALTEAANVDKMLTTDPHSWPENAYTTNASTGHDSDDTIISVGVIYARPTDDRFEQRIVLTLGVLYP